MKNILIPLILAFVIPFAMCGNGEDSSDQPQVTNPPVVPPIEKISDYILSASITNKHNTTVKIDNQTKTIDIGLTKNAGDGSDVQIKFVLNENVSMYFPKEEETIYDLATGSVWLEYNKSYIKYTFVREYIETPDIDPVTKGWTLTNTFGSLPEGIKVYKSPEQMFNKNTIAYIATVDMTEEDREFEILGGESIAGGKTAKQFYNEYKSSIIINGGYFWYSSNTGKLHHIGLLVQSGIEKSTAATTSTRKDNKDQNGIFYPTRAIFSMTRSKSFASNWAYSVSGSTYAYPKPSPIEALAPPQPIPSANFPSGGWVLSSKEAIGAGPVLLHQGKIYNTWEEEIWDTIGGANAEYDNVPRSAIGVTENRKLILFAGEGRNITPGVIGFSTQEVAEILQSLGCVDAINLDGGGSTCMLINGKETVRPSGNGVQRAIVTAISIK